MKDLEIIKNRRLDRVVIVDNSIISFAKHINNGIHIPSYFAQPNDYELERVMVLLKRISRCHSIPNELRKILKLQETYERYLEEN